MRFGLFVGLCWLGIASSGVGQNIPFNPLPSRAVETNSEPTFDISALPPSPGAPGMPLSPATSTNFQGLLDNSTFFPPDVAGTVGTNHVMLMLNTQVRVQTRTGLILQTTNLPAFWTSTNTSFADVFDPRVLYDPYNHRWIACALTDGNTTNSSLLIGVSSTSNPTDGWNLRQVDVSPGGTLWADYPQMGFNKNWIVVQANMWTVNPTNSTFNRSHIYVFNKTNLYNGNFTSPTLLARTNLNDAGGEVPAVYYDNTATNLYLLQHVTGSYSNQTWLRLFNITGLIGSPTLQYNYSSNATYINTTALFADQPNSYTNFAPQSNTTIRVELNDSWSALNVVYRNSHLWAAHTIFLPTPNPTRSAIQWYQIRPNTTIVQRGRIDDSLGVNFYGYPSIAVNRFNDVLVGYSRFSANTFPSAYYSFKSACDTLNSIQTPALLKAGEGAYIKYSGSNSNYNNRWGDYSSTVADPVNDTDFWTVQEYASTPIGSLTNYAGQWGTWWGQLTLPVPSNDNFANATIIESCHGTNTGTIVRATRETGEPNHAGTNNSPSVWYRWTSPNTAYVRFTTTNTTGCGGSSLDSIIAVYTGSAVNSLTGNVRRLVENRLAERFITRLASKFQVESFDAPPMRL